MPRLIKVTGLSMAPTLNAGDYLLTIKPRTFRAGLIYVMEHERHGRIVKRLTRVNADMASYESDNPEGSSGEIATAKITSRAWLAITPKGIKRL